MPLKEINYDKTHFYKLMCKDFNITDCYVGHTTDWVKRKSDHKHRCNNPNRGGHNLPVYKFMRENGGWENWEMLWIKTLKCENAMEARSEERKCKEQLNATLNGNVPSRTFDEYRETNKDKIKEYAVEYRKNNKDKIKEYTERNKEHRKQYNKDYREKNHEKLCEDKKQDYQKNKEHRLQKFKEDKEQNPEKYKEKAKKAYLKRREKLRTPYTCSCGVVLCMSGKARHEKSNKHKQYLQSQTNPQE